MSIQTFIETIRVLAEGESKEGDTKLLPTDLFDTRGEVIDQLVDILEAAEEDPTLLYDLMKWLVIIDTRIGFRFDPEAVGTSVTDDPFTILIAETYSQLNSVFSISQAEVVLAVSEGTVGYGYEGLCGVLLQALESIYNNGKETVERLRALLDFHKRLCETNPSIMTVWWMDAIADIYNTTTELDDAGDMYDHTEDTVKEGIRAWYVTNIPTLHSFWDNYASVVQNFPPTSPVTVLYEDTMGEMENVNNLAAGRSMVDQPAEVLARRVTTVEELFIDLLID